MTPSLQSAHWFPKAGVLQLLVDNLTLAVLLLLQMSGAEHSSAGRTWRAFKHIMDVTGI